MSEARVRNITGWSAGLTLRKLGGVVISIGSLRAAVVSADWTSSAAPSMLRSSSNCMVIEVTPKPLVEVIELIPENGENCRPSGAAPDQALASALAPDKYA